MFVTRLLAMLLLLPLTGNGDAQTLKGAVTLDFEGYVERRDDDNTWTNVSLGSSYLQTDRIGFGFAGGVRKFPDFATSYWVAGDISYFFNMEPGVQKFIPQIRIRGGGLWGGDDTATFGIGSLGTRYYFNNHAGFTSNLSYARQYSDRGELDYSSIGIYWGLFVQFKVE